LFINRFCFVFPVSNEIPDVPVISPSSGAIFERRLIEKFLQENGVDPITGKDLTPEELIEIKSRSLVSLALYNFSPFTI
jgi:pre-mRNA-processing factor 19